MAQTYEYVAICLFGLERLVGEEIEALGYEKTNVMDGRVTFRAGIDAMARANLWLRYAERVYLKMGEFPAADFTQLFDGTEALPWENWIGREDGFPVKGDALRSQLFSVPDCQRIVKKAVARRLERAYGQRWFAETGVKYQIVFFLFRNVATLMIDTSGAPLYKRGYRTETGEAPLRETLAAAMARISRPREEVLLWDPLCGSGTIPIEAALLMTNTAPGLHRTFACESFGAVSPAVFVQAREEAAAAVKKTSFEAYASDIDQTMVHIAQENIARAGMASCVRAFVKDARTIQTGGRRGTIVTNPPYGERLMTPEQAHELYTELGAQFATLDRWQMYILSADEDFPHWFHRRADKIRRVYNGRLRCFLYQYFRNADHAAKFEERRQTQKRGSSKSPTARVSSFDLRAGDKHNNGSGARVRQDHKRPKQTKNKGDA